MRISSRDLAMTTIFAALYAIGVIVLAPISFGIYQVRVADALLPLAIILGVPVALGTSLGCVIANIYGGLGLIDIIGGAIANFLACLLAAYIGGESFTKRIVGCLVETLTITVIVGGYLSVIFNVPVETGVIGVLVGSIISINILGFTILEVLLRGNIVRK
ncbi:MAG: QueT transporter family protein [Candidatus Bathyarchaeia archaeon]